MFELIVVFLFRFFGALIIQILFIYSSELFPSQVGGLGIGLVSIVIAIPNIFLAELINSLNKINFPFSVLFIVFSCLFLGFLWFAKETHG